MKREPIALYIVTGFLGSGKSTLLNALFQEEDFHDTAVIINELGAVSIDHLLVKKADESIIELANGCLCCSMQGDFIDTLLDLIEKAALHQPPLRRVIIETTGVADLSTLLQAVMGHPILSKHFRVENIVTLVDALQGQSLLNKYQEAWRQVIFADTLLITKSDLLSEGENCEALKHYLQQLNPQAEIFVKTAETNNKEIVCCPRALQSFESKLAAYENRIDLCKPQGNLLHGEGVSYFSLTFDKPFNHRRFDQFMDRLWSFYAQDILRLKGFVCFEEEQGSAYIFHAVQGFFHPPQYVKNYEAYPHIRLVLLAKKKAQQNIADLFHAFVGQITPDGVDKEVLLENPLAIPGMKF